MLQTDRKYTYPIGWYITVYVSLDISVDEISKT